MGTVREKVRVCVSEFVAWMTLLAMPRCFLSRNRSATMATTAGKLKALPRPANTRANSMAVKVVAVRPSRPLMNMNTVESARVLLPPILSITILAKIMPTPMHRVEVVCSRPPCPRFAPRSSTMKVNRGGTMKLNSPRRKDRIRWNTKKRIARISAFLVRLNFFSCIVVLLFFLHLPKQMTGTRERAYPRISRMAFLIPSGS